MVMLPRPGGLYGTPPFNPGDTAIIDRLRQGNIYNPVGAAGPDLLEPMPTLDESGVEEFESETPAYDALVELMGARPEYEGPGVLRRIAASMMALRDPRLAMAVMQETPREILDWERQIEGATSAAELEQRQEDLRRRRETGETERMRAETANARLEFDRLKHENPQLEIIKPESGNYKIYNPADGSITETEFSVGDITPQEEAELRVKTEQQITDIRRGRTREEIAQRGEEQRKTVRERAEETRRTARERPRGTTGAQELERRRAIANRAQEYILRNPEMADFIEVDMSSGEVTIKPAADRWFRSDFTPEQRQEAIDAIFGEDTGDEPAPETDRVIVEKDGRRFSLPKNQLEQAIAQGYKQVS